MGNSKAEGAWCSELVFGSRCWFGLLLLVDLLDRIQETPKPKVKEKTGENTWEAQGGILLSNRMYKVRGVFFTEPGVRAVGDLGWIETNSRPTNCEKWTSLKTLGVLSTWLGLTPQDKRREGC